jgi:hypothetical protein
MEVDACSDQLQTAQQYFCGVCWKECGELSGYGGRWQKYGADGSKSLYICRLCSFEKWRDWTKCEEFKSHHDRNLGYLIFLEEELQKRKAG